MWPFKRRPSKTRPRRRHARLRPDGSRGTCSLGEIEIANISPTGLGFTTANRDGLSPGDRHLVIVEDHKGHSFEAFGEVRWCGERPGVDGAYTAGLAFVSILRDDPRGRWAGVLAEPGFGPGGSNFLELESEPVAEEPEEAGAGGSSSGERRSRVLNLASFRRRTSR